MNPVTRIPHERSIGSDIVYSNNTEELPSASWQDSLTLPLFAYIHGERELRGHGGGLNPYQTCMWLQQYCRAQFPDIAPLLDYLNVSTYDITYVQVEEILLSLKIGARVVTSGGWTDSSNIGHAMLYCFMRTSEQEFSIYVFNSGMGLEHNHRSIIDQGKTKFCPFIWYPAVPWHKVRRVLPLLIAMQRGPIAASYGLHPCTYLYKKVLYEILGSSYPSPHEFFITPQRTGSCSYRVFLAWLQFCLPRNRYKQWHHALRMDTITAWTQRAQKGEHAPGGIYALKFATENTLYAANKLLSQGILGEQEAQKSKEICEKALQCMKSLPPRSMQEEEDRNPHNAPPFRDWIDRVLSQRATIVVRLQDEPQLVRVLQHNQKLEEALQNLLFLKDMVNTPQDRAFLMFAIDQVVRSLPIDSRQWDDKSIAAYGGILAICIDLYAIHVAYKKMFCVEIQRLPHHLHTQLRIIIILHILACLHAPELTRFKFSLPSFDSSSDPLVYCDPLDWHHAHQLWKYFEGTTGGITPLCQYDIKDGHRLHKQVSKDIRSNDCFLFHAEALFLSCLYNLTHEEKIKEPYLSQIFRDIADFYIGKILPHPLFYLHHAVLDWYRCVTNNLHKEVKTNWTIRENEILYKEDPEGDPWYPLVPCSRVSDSGPGVDIFPPLEAWPDPTKAEIYRGKPHVLIQDIKAHYSPLQTPRNRIQLERFLFQSGQDVAQFSHHALQQSTCDHKKEYLKFLSQIKEWQNERPFLYSDFRLFWVRCVQLLCGMNPGLFLSQVTDQIKNLNAWLSDPKLELQIKSRIHLYRAHAYVLIGIDTLTPDGKRELLISWISALYFLGSDSTADLDIMTRIRRSILSYQDSVWKYVDDGELHRNPMSSCVADRHVLWNCTRRGWILDFSCDSVYCIYSIHLLSGAYSIISIPDKDKFHIYAATSCLFHGSLTIQQVNQTYIIFTHPEYGEARAWYSDSRQSWQIERRVSGLWYLYLTPNTPRPEVIPWNIWWTHSHWILLPEQQSTKEDPCVVVSPLGSAQIVYEMHLDLINGEPKYWKKINPPSEIMLRPIRNHYVQRLPETMAARVSSCESPDHVWIERDDIEYQHMVFPRFVNEQGTTLQFYWHEGAWRWSRAPSYSLENWGDAELPHLGAFRHFLYLKHTADQALLLVPLQATYWTKKWTCEVHFTLQTPNRNRNGYQESRHGQYRYVVMEWKKGKLIPRSSAASCFLAYLYFVCRSYAPAVDLLKQLLAGPPPSVQDNQILDLFLQKESAVNSSPSAAAVRLYVLALQARSGRDITISYVTSNVNGYCCAAWKVPSSIQPDQCVWGILGRYDRSLDRIRALRNRDKGAVISYPRLEEIVCRPFQESDPIPIVFGEDFLHTLGSRLLMLTKYLHKTNLFPCEAGLLIWMGSQSMYELSSEVIIQEVLNEVTECIPSLQKALAALEGKILKLATQSMSTASQLLRTGGFLPDYSIEECINWMLYKRDAIELLRNEDLSATDRAELRDILQQYVVWCRQKQKTQRVVKILQELADLQQQGNVVSDCWVQRLAQEVSTSFAYELSMHPEMLVFEYRSDIQMSPMQVRWIKEVTARSPVQNISCFPREIEQITPLLLFTLAQSGRIPMLIVPDAQLAFWTGQLHQSLYHCFRQSIHCVNVPNSHHVCGEVIEQLLLELQIAKQQKGICVLPQRLLPWLQAVLCSLMNFEGDKTIRDEKNIQNIHTIFSIIYQHGYLIYDPLDKAFSPHIDLRQPIDRPAAIPADDIARLRHLITILYPTIHPLRDHPDCCRLFRSLVPKLALDWMHSIESRMLEPYEQSFIRFLTYDLKEEDQQFLSALESWVVHRKATCRKIAESVYQVRYFVTSLIPFVLAHHQQLATVVDHNRVSLLMEEVWVSIAYDIFEACAQEGPTLSERAEKWKPPSVSFMQITSNIEDLAVWFKPENRVSLLKMPYQGPLAGAYCSDAPERQEDQKMRLLARISDYSCTVKVLSNPTVQKIMDSLDGGAPKGMAIFDAIGMWKVSSPICPIKELVTYMNKSDIEDGMDAVLFIQEQHWIAWRRGDAMPIRMLKGKPLSDYNLDLGRCITWYDRKHDYIPCLEHPPGTHIFMIVDSTIDLRPLYYNPFCMSEHPFSYPIQFLIADTEVTCLSPGKNLIEQIITTASNNQERALQKHALYTYQRQLEGVMRRGLWQQYLSSTEPRDRQRWIQVYQDFVSTAVPVLPCEPYARSLQTVRTKPYLIEKADYILKLIRDKIPGKDQHTLINEVESLKQHIQYSTALAESSLMNSMRDWTQRQLQMLGLP